MSKSRRIYVVDDDPEVLRGLDKNLTEAGFEVRTAGDGTGLLGVLHTFQPDLVVLDLGLPGDDGLTLTRSIRQTSDVPVIMLTGRVDEVDRIGRDQVEDYARRKAMAPEEIERWLPRNLGYEPLGNAA